MGSSSLFDVKVDELFEELVNEENLKNAFKLVKRNKGAPGVDNVTIDDFAKRLHEEVSKLSKDLNVLD